MKKITSIKLLLSYLLLFFIAGCNVSSDSPLNNDTSYLHKPILKVLSKPGSSFRDTLFITDSPIVVFYNPDKTQLDSFKLITTSAVFQSRTHEFFFQQRNAKIILKRDWQKLKKVVSEKARYIAFKSNNLKTIQVIDLNALEDISGMILWDGRKNPHPIDMMSVETELSYYFIKN